MTTHNYIRVIPRDLFNEANLLKCLGKVYLNLERLNLPGVELEHQGDEFKIEQNPDDGSICAANVLLRAADGVHLFHRPLNSREPWPLYLIGVDDSEIPVFREDGEFSDEMLDFVGASDPEPDSFQAICPNCGGSRFDITVQNTATVTFGRDGNHDVDDVTDEAQWEDDSPITCANESCSFTGKFKDVRRP